MDRIEMSQQNLLVQSITNKGGIDNLTRETERLTEAVDRLTESGGWKAITSNIGVILQIATLAVGLWYVLHGQQPPH